MAFTTPEIIEPGSLLIPTGRDAFTVVSGGLPNGDDCLEMNGPAGDAAYEAKAAAVAGVHYVADRSVADVPLTISFWVKAPTVPGAAITGPSSYLLQRHMLGVHGSGFTSASTNILNGTTVASHFAWGIFPFGASTGVDSAAIAFVCPYSNSQFPAQTSNTVGGVIPLYITPDTWNLVHIVRENHTPERWTGYVNGQYAGTVTSYGTVLNPTGSAQQVNIGCYSTLANVAARQDVWQIGKLTFHQERLTHAQRVAMYESMKLAITSPAFPADSALLVANESNAEGAGSEVLPLPANAAAGDLVTYLICGYNLNGTDWTLSAGWDSTTTVNANSWLRITTARRVLTGTTGDNILTITPTGFNPGGNRKVIGFRVPDGKHIATTGADVAVAGATGWNTAADPPLVTPATARNHIVLATALLDPTGSPTFTGTPAGYTELLSDSVGFPASVYWARSSAASYNPGAFTNPNNVWTTHSVAIPVVPDP